MRRRGGGGSLLCNSGMSVFPARGIALHSLVSHHTTSASLVEYGSCEARCKCPQEKSALDTAFLLVSGICTPLSSLPSTPFVVPLVP